MTIRSSRRGFLLTTGATSVALAAGGPSARAAAEAPAAEIPALLPRGDRGHQFVFYADCCSGVAGAGNERSHAAVNRVVARIQPRPEFIAFPGDAVVGYVADAAVLRGQWDYWWNTEMAWLQQLGIPLYQSTSNHNTYDLSSEEVFRAVHPHLPQNGPDDFRGLAYAARIGDLLYVSTHQPDRTRPYRRDMRIDTTWLDEMLSAHADARYKFVSGHYPVFPVNGYFQSPLWCFRPDERRPFWEVLVKHNVQAYLCSHILAYDVQIHDGIPQILSGGAGTQGSGPLALMPSRSEYLHCVQVAVDDQGLRCRTLDVDGNAGESFSWPCPLPTEGWMPVTPADCLAQLSPLSADGNVTAFRFDVHDVQPCPDGQAQTLLWGWDSKEGLATIWIGWEGTPPRLTVRLIPQTGYGWQVWTGPQLAVGQAWQAEVALHAGLGPGGVLWRRDERSAWRSLGSTSSKGVEGVTWPRSWAIGHGPSGPTEWPCLSPVVNVHWVQSRLPDVG